MMMRNNDIKRLIRHKTGRVVGGVCIALAQYFHIDVTVIRIIFVFLLIPGGLPGFIPYILLWILIPEEK